MEGYNINDGRSRQKIDEAYGYKITTDKGHADIIFRNSSNGHYGGWLKNANILKEIPNDLKEIRSDWSA